MRRFRRCPISSGCLEAYLDGESLILFSRKSGRVYGFERESAALFLEIDERLAKEGMDPAPFSGNRVVETMVRLLSCEEEEEERYEPPLPIGPQPEEESGREAYRTASVTFCIDYPTDSLARRIAPMFDHLKKAPLSRKGRRIDIDFEKRESGWGFSFNGVPVVSEVSEELLPLVLQENMIIAFYQSEPYLMALHAGAVGKRGRAVVLPGESGSGKTTLTAALSAAGFDLYSDEIALVGYDGTIRKIPFCMNIKEGSWSVLQKSFPQLAKAPEYRRFDGQRVKLLPPENPGEERIGIEAFVFPEYVEGASCELLPMTSCETLGRIKEAGYQLERPLTSETLGKILTHLLERPSYTLRYGTLEAAVEEIGRLCRG
ncbi:hypothetical protein [Hydrogenimonas sp.]